MTSRPAPTVSIAQLERRVSRIILALGGEPDIAAEVARHLVRAEASGHASHGVLRLPQYRAEVARGVIVPAARPKIVHDGGATAVVDAHHGFGHYSTAFATALLADRATEHGIAAVAVRRTTHIGRLGEYSERLNARGLLSIITVGAAGPGIGSMAPFRTKSGPHLNSNPFALAFPAARHDFVFDGSMSNIAEGKVHAARDRGVSLPEGAILDAEGKPSTHPGDFYDGGTLTPLGGDLAGHKGYGLALAAALLGGLAHADGSSPDVTGIAATAAARPDAPRIGGTTLLAVDPRSFGSRAESYSKTVGQVLDAFRDSGAMVPGDFEADRRGDGEHLTLESRTEQTLARLEADLGDLLDHS
ncbi:Ldh family oxidoreductase [Nonomuraea sp. NPDC050153]|uniref:Ldh family oxidoreductase n=1 Tax=Nonomuraea sp. NPDC050153 TaxID=3364359 RepID=UPI00379A0A35